MNIIQVPLFKFFSLLIYFFQLHSLKAPNSSPLLWKSQWWQIPISEALVSSEKINISPRGAILLPSSPLELTPAGRASPSPAGLTSPSLSRASLLLHEARLSVLLLLLPLQPPISRIVKLKRIYLLLLAVVLVSYPDNLSDKWLGVLWPRIFKHLRMAPLNKCASLRGPGRSTRFGG